jgi:hypothetical protein
MGVGQETRQGSISRIDLVTHEALQETEAGVAPTRVRDECATSCQR